MKKILIVSPYHGGSHQAWAEGYQKHGRHQVSILSLPARFWKWRMHGGAVTLARRFLESRERPDLILATDMLDLTTFLALTRQATHQVPTALYMHENQLTYPLPEDGSSGPMRRQLGERDHHYAFINFSSMLAADHIFFNSEYHLDAFFDELPRFLNHFPEYNELGRVDSLRAKSRVLPVGIDLKRLDLAGETGEKAGDPPLILWNQRWEYDKNPGGFFKALYQVKKEGIPFRLVLCGQQFGKRPPVFDEAADKLAGEIVHMGYAPGESYKEWLWRADITISTARHEFFGISILEAIYCHTFPVLPHRLSYPELIPTQFHLRCLYQNQGGLVQRLRWALTHRAEATAIAGQLKTAVEKYDWSNLASQYDARFSELIFSAGS